MCSTPVTFVIDLIQSNRPLQLTTTGSATYFHQMLGFDSLANTRLNVSGDGIPFDLVVLTRFLANLVLFDRNVCVCPAEDPKTLDI
jgi:hypothetical protein